MLTITLLAILWTSVRALLHQYSVQFVLLNKHQTSGGGAYLHCYQQEYPSVTVGEF